MKQCPKCLSDHSKDGVFCSRSCANSRVFSSEALQKKSIANKKYFLSKLSSEEIAQRERISTKVLVVKNSVCEACETNLVGKQQKYCSTKCRNITSNLKFQNYKSQKERGFQKKYAAIVKRGGGCSSCGYNKNLASLCFHHLRDKEFSLDFRGFANMSPQKIEAELDKCIVLCHNCHMEEHNPEMFLDGRPSRILKW